MTSTSARPTTDLPARPLHVADVRSMENGEGGGWSITCNFPGQCNGERQGQPLAL